MVCWKCTCAETYAPLGAWLDVYKQKKAQQTAVLSCSIFLVQYLGNGFNLADAAHLTYNDHYFQSGKKSFQFVRQKTEDRSDNEVVIPIIPPLQTILDQIAAPPIKGSLVFPGISGDAMTPIERRKRVAMENQNIKKRVRRLVKSMGWEVQPSCTGADTLSQLTSLMPEFLITTYPRVWVTQ